MNREEHDAQEEREYRAYMASKGRGNHAIPVKWLNAAFRIALRDADKQEAHEPDRPNPTDAEKR